VTEGAHGGRSRLGVGIEKKERGTTCKFFKEKRKIVSWYYGGD